MRVKCRNYEGELLLIEQDEVLLNFGSSHMTYRLELYLGNGETVDIRHLQDYEIEVINAKYAD